MMTASSPGNLPTGDVLPHLQCKLSLQRLRGFTRHQRNSRSITGCFLVLAHAANAEQTPKGPDALSAKVPRIKRCAAMLPGR